MWRGLTLIAEADEGAIDDEDEDLERVDDGNIE